MSKIYYHKIKVNEKKLIIKEYDYMLYNKDRIFIEEGNKWLFKSEITNEYIEQNCYEDYFFYSFEKHDSQKVKDKIREMHLEELSDLNQELDELEIKMNNVDNLIEEEN